METTDWIMLILGLVWGIVMFILLKGNKSKPRIWSGIFGIGTGVYAFVSLMVGSILQRPILEFTEYTITNFLLSLPFAVIGYFAGRKLASRFPKGL